MIEKTSAEIVLEAVEDLHRMEQAVTREALAEFTGLKRSIIDDRLKALAMDERIIRVERGVYVPAVRHPPARQISHTELPDGTVVLDVGDDVLHLTPREARTLGAMLGGRAIQASQIDLGNHAAVMAAQLSAQVRRLEREVQALKTDGSSALQMDFLQE